MTNLTARKEGLDGSRHGYRRVPELEIDLPEVFQVVEDTEHVALQCLLCNVVQWYSASGALTPQRIAQDARLHLILDHGAAPDSASSL